MADQEPVTVTLTLPPVFARRLEVLIDPDQGVPGLKAIIGKLIDHAQQGVYRPGSWERPWLIAAFGIDWLYRLEPDTDDTAADGRVIFDRPRRHVPPDEERRQR